MPANPRAAASRILSTGKYSFSSHSAANGASRSRAKRRAASSIARWSSLSSKSMAAHHGRFRSVQPRISPLFARRKAGPSKRCLESPVRTWQEIGMSKFPATRMRRLRRHDWTRRLVAETTLSAQDFIWPLFIIDGQKQSEPVPSMPGVERLSVDLAVGAAEEAAKLGIPAIALFPYTDPALR